MEKAHNVVLVAPQGLGKTMIAQNMGDGALDGVAVGPLRPGPVEVCHRLEVGLRRNPHELVLEAAQQRDRRREIREPESRPDPGFTGSLLSYFSACRS